MSIVSQKTVLTQEEEEHIIKTFTTKEVVEDFSVVVSYDELEAKNYSLSAGQYFEIKIEYIEISKEEFINKLNTHESSLNNLFDESKKIEKEINSNLKKLKYD